MGAFRRRGGFAARKRKEKNTNLTPVLRRQRGAPLRYGTGTPKPTVFALEAATSTPIFNNRLYHSFTPTSTRWAARGGGRGGHCRPRPRSPGHPMRNRPMPGGGDREILAVTLSRRGMISNAGGANVRHTRRRRLTMRYSLLLLGTLLTASGGNSAFA